MTAKHRLVNNVLWRVVTGQIRKGHGPDAACWLPLGQLCFNMSFGQLHVYN